jgi:hypothetical protein
VAALLLVLLGYGALVGIIAATDRTPAVQVVDEVMRRLGEPAAVQSPDPAPACRELIVVDEYGTEVEVRECD